MPVSLGPAVAAGLIGGVLMLVVERLPLGRASGAFGLGEMWATLLALRGRLAFVGPIVHLVVSGAIGVLYAMGFRIAGAVDQGWAWGLVGGVIHWLVAGSFLAGVPPRTDGSVPAPGRFAMLAGSTGALLFLVGHLLYGVVVGVAYFALNAATRAAT